MNLTTPPSVQKLQKALHDKAKGSPNFRFYALYDKMYRKDVLAFAYECCKANGGAAGVDGQTFEGIEDYGVERWLDELAQELKSREISTQSGAASVYSQTGWQAAAVRSAHYPGPDGGNGSSSRTRTDFRGGSATGTVRLSAGPQRTGRRQACP